MSSSRSVPFLSPRLCSNYIFPHNSLVRILVLSVRLLIIIFSIYKTGMLTIVHSGKVSGIRNRETRQLSSSSGPQTGRGAASHLFLYSANS